MSDLTFDAGVVSTHAGDVLVDVAVLAGLWRAGAHTGAVLGALGVTLHRCGSDRAPGSLSVEEGSDRSRHS